MDEQRYAYVARCRKCGGFVMATVDNPNRKDDVANTVAEYIRLGYFIEYIRVEPVPEIIDCACEVEEAKPPEPIFDPPLECDLLKDEEIRQIEQATPTTAYRESAWRCRTCGKDNEPDVEYCLRCGDPKNMPTTTVGA